MSYLNIIIFYQQQQPMSLNCSNHHIFGNTTTLPTEGQQLQPPEQKQCRICLVDQHNFQFIEPCQCSGSMQYVHFQCQSKWIQKSNPQLKKQDHDQHTHTCEMCKYKIKYSCQQKYVCTTCTHLCNKIKIKLPVFVVLVLVTIACIGLIAGGCFFITSIDRNNKSNQFTFVVLVISVVVIGVLFAIVVYVWVADYFLREVREIVTIQNKKKIKRKKSVHDVVARPTDTLKPPLTLHSKSTGTRMTVYPQLFIAHLE